jgi:hypothetical protein
MWTSWQSRYQYLGFAHLVERNCHFGNLCGFTGIEVLPKLKLLYAKYFGNADIKNSKSGLLVLSIFDFGLARHFLRIQFYQLVSNIPFRECFMLFRKELYLIKGHMLKAAEGVTAALPGAVHDNFDKRTEENARPRDASRPPGSWLASRALAP